MVQEESENKVEKKVDKEVVVENPKEEAKVEKPDTSSKGSEPSPEPSQAPKKSNSGLIIGCACCSCLFIVLAGLLIMYFMLGGWFGIQSWLVELSSAIRG